MTDTSKALNSQAEKVTGKDWQDAIFSALAKKSNPLSGVISDEAFRAVVQSQLDAMKRAGRIVIADLDGADGKFDGIIHRETLERKMGVFAETFGLPKDVVAARIKEFPETIRTDELNARLDRSFQPKSVQPEVQNGLPTARGKEPAKGRE